MKIAGIIAEYNPFHNGHEYQLLKTRENGATHIVAVMSGSIVQRGEISVFSKWNRAKAAVLSGVDLVIELPVLYSLSSAEIFAKSSLFLLNNIGVDSISFGSETGDINQLYKLHSICELAKKSHMMKIFLDKGFSYPRCIYETVKELYSKDFAEQLKLPNNILGIEYINSINTINSNIVPYTIKRKSVGHDSNKVDGKFASASYIRDIIKTNNIESVRRFVPDNIFYIYESSCLSGEIAFEDNIEQAILFHLKLMSKDDFLLLPDVLDGLESRFYNSAQESLTLSDFYEKIKTKRYTFARIRRIVYYALLSIKKSDVNHMPQYIRVLASNKKGFEILKNAKINSDIPIHNKFAEICNAGYSDAMYDIRATDLQSFSFNQKQKSRMDFVKTPFIET